MQPKRIIHQSTSNDPDKELDFIIYQQTIKSMSHEELIIFLLNQVTQQDLYLKQLLKNVMDLSEQINQLKDK